MMLMNKVTFILRDMLALKILILNNQKLSEKKIRESHKC